jgi:chemotaxis protein methyltransferase CheR
MDKQYVLDAREFDQIRRIVYDRTGINLSEAKREMVYSRLSKRLRQLGLNGFREYCELIEEDNSNELGNFINSITTNLTAFFREKHHFDFLKQTLVPSIVNEGRPGNTIRIWSAGCSTGEEPYSLAITMTEALRSFSGWSAKILATDLDTAVLETGRNGIYGVDRVKGLPESVVKKWFNKGSGGNEGKVRVKSELRQMIMFKQLNLMGEWPVKQGIDILFCRNVVIYFDKPTQSKLFERFANHLRPEGYLFIGHSENLYKVSERFDLLGQTIYRKIQ